MSLKREFHSLYDIKQEILDNSLSKADSINNVIARRDFHVKRWMRYLFSYKQDIKEYHL